MKKIVLLFASLIAFGSAYSQANVTQTVNVVIPAVTLINIASNTTQTMTLGAPTVAGANATDVSTPTNTIYIQYSSIMSATSTAASRSIYVTSSTTETSLAGIKLTVAASIPTVDATGVASNGNLGTTGGTVNIINPGLTVAGIVSTGVPTSTSPKLVQGITSGFTGTTNTSGASVVYTASINTAVSAAIYATIRAKSYAVAVLYTLADTI
jgi:hypothetical protein